MDCPGRQVRSPASEVPKRCLPAARSESSPHQRPQGRDALPRVLDDRSRRSATLPSASRIPLARAAGPKSGVRSQKAVSACGSLGELAPPAAHGEGRASARPHRPVAQKRDPPQRFAHPVGTGGRSEVRRPKSQSGVCLRLARRARPTSAPRGGTRFRASSMIGRAEARPSPALRPSRWPGAHPQPAAPPPPRPPPRRRLSSAFHALICSRRAFTRASTPWSVGT